MSNEEKKLTISTLDGEATERIRQVVNSQIIPQTPIVKLADVSDDARKRFLAPSKYAERRHPYLVRGAHLKCSFGSHHSILDMPRSHGVYVGKSKDAPLLNAADCKFGEGYGYNIRPFGVCGSPDCRGGETVSIESETENPATGKAYKDGYGNPVKSGAKVQGHPCRAVVVGMWHDTNPATVVRLKGEPFYEALTTESFLLCKYGGEIRPVDSGQPPLEPPKMDFDAIALAYEGGDAAAIAAAWSSYRFTGR
jgi:hypothetical protein